MAFLGKYHQRRFFFAFSRCLSKSPRICVGLNSQSLFRQNSTSQPPIKVPPLLVSPSFWYSLLPSYIRYFKNPSRSREWNPATFYIIISLLIGSNAINMVALKNDSVEFSRRADIKIALLKNAIGRVQRGEYVDIEKLLGTGNVEQEEEWEDGK